MTATLHHLDLFSGIGGFSLAVEQVWPDIEHTFVENDSFCTAVLKKHWPNATIHGDIRRFIIDTDGKVVQGAKQLKNKTDETFILTGGFPCQPFSHAGRRKGTADDRYLWPEMFRVIQLYQPTWIIAENVRGLTTWNDGMVLETVCTDLESEGYEVQPFIIPACAVGAPHRRERVWIVAHATSEQSIGGMPEAVCRKERGQDDELHAELTDADCTTSHTRCERREQRPIQNIQPESEKPEWTNDGIGSSEWHRDWREVALATCNDRVDDGLPRQMDGATISGARHRKERLKACGNAIVPQVAVEIMKAIKAYD